MFIYKVKCIVFNYYIHINMDKDSRLIAEVYNEALGGIGRNRGGLTTKAIGLPKQTLGGNTTNSIPITGKIPGSNSDVPLQMNNPGNLESLDGEQISEVKLIKGHGIMIYLISGRRVYISAL